MVSRKARIDAAWSGIQASIADALQASLEAVVAFGNRTIGTFQGAFDAMVVIWSNLPRAIGDLTIQAANALIAGLESMLNGAVDGINALLESVNAGLAAIGIERAIGITPAAIVGSYLLRALVFGIVGVSLGALLMWLGVAPLFERHPLSFPTGPVTLSLTGTVMRRNAAVMLLVAVLGALAPAWRTVRTKLLDAIWG